MRVTDEAFLGKLSRATKNVNGVLFTIEPSEAEAYEPLNKKGINILKRFAKRWPRFYEILRLAFGPGLSINRHYSARDALRHFYPDDDLSKRCIISVGSGVKRIHPGVIQLDIYPLANVDLVADARDLPLRDASVDMVICEAVLEHVADAQAVIQEILRVLKPGGQVYVTVPFVYSFHSSPNDFHRWSLPGIMHEFKEYVIVKSGMCAGPAGALQGILMHFFSLPLSLGWYPLYQIWSIFFMILFSPLKLLDLIWGEIPNATDIAAVIYIMATKAER